MNAITLRGYDRVEVPPTPPEVLAARDELVAKVSTFTSVKTQADHDRLKELEEKMEQTCRVVEGARVALTEGPLKTQRDLMTAKKTFCGPLEAAVAKCRELRKRFNLALQEARDKAELERLAAERKAREATEREEKRIRDEAAAKLKEIEAAKPAFGGNPFAAVAAAIQIEQAAQKAIAQAQPAPVAVAMPAAPIPLKKVWKWEVTNIGVFSNRHPELVTITPKIREIQKQIDAGIREMDGLKIWEEKELRR